MNKLCDGADWFDPDIGRILRDALHERPRFHRKQWEFAVIYRELERLGLLGGGAEGISFGSGCERILYAVARRVKHLWATDLYEPGTSWDPARTDDPTAHVRAHAPFAYPVEAVHAKRMDMRAIDFPDDSFDFAYSSCAIEHIGGREDFARHLAEVRRVLRPGGAYVFTTEFTWALRPAELAGDWFFSASLLDDLVKESGLDGGPVFDAHLTPHGINTPLPLELAGGRNDGEGRFNERLFGELAHLQLASANTPFTSCVVVLRKTGEAPQPWRWEGLEASRRYVEERMEVLRRMVEEAELCLHPFAGMPDRRARAFLGHEAFFAAAPPPPGPAPGALFHSAFVWLGRAPRMLRFSLCAERDFEVELRVNRMTLRPPWGEVTVAARLGGTSVDGRLRRELLLQPEDDCVYAVLAEARGQAQRELRFDELHVTAAPAGAGTLWQAPAANALAHPAAALFEAAKALAPSGVRRALKRLAPRVPHR